MTDSSERVSQLISRYFTQLTQGCQNPDCQNQNCASSSLFSHRDIQPNEAAALTIDLLRNRAPLCVSTPTAPPPHNSPTPSQDPINQSPESSILVDSSQIVSNSATSLTSNTTVDSTSRRTSTGAHSSSIRPTRLLDTPTGELLLSQLLDWPGNSTLRSILGRTEPHRPPYATNLRQNSSYDELFEDIQRANQNQPAGEKQWTLQLASALSSSASTSSQESGEPELRSQGLTLIELQTWIDSSRSSGDWSQLIHILSTVFKSFNALSQSFINSETIQSPSASQQDQSALQPVSPINIGELKKAWSEIDILNNSPLIDAVTIAIRQLVHTKLASVLYVYRSNQLDNADDTSHEAHDLRQRVINIFLILFECPYVTDPLYFERLLPYLNRCVTWLPTGMQAQLCRVLKDASVHQCHQSNATSSDDDHHRSSILWSLHRINQHHITFRSLLSTSSQPNDDIQVCEAAVMSRLIYYTSLLAGQLDSDELRVKEEAINRDFEASLPTRRRHSENRRLPFSLPKEDPLGKELNISPNDCRKPLIPDSEFVNEILNNWLKPEDDIHMLQLKTPGSFAVSFSTLPFLLQTSTKITLLRYTNRTRMLYERSDAFLQFFQSDFVNTLALKLRVKRDTIVEDALLGLEIVLTENPGDLKKQLKIEFEGEEGIDEGGLSKEFFQLIIERVFDPIYGMFVVDDESNLCWFNPNPMDDMEREYCLIGMLFGLAIYNECILDVHFPSILYRKLVGKLATFDDLADLRPSLARGLQDLLAYEGDDLTEVFDCNFEISYMDLFGSTRTHELKENGASIPVTAENKKEYVELYADFILNTSVKNQFTAFRRGFHCVVDESPLTFLFSPNEIELLVCGSRDFDFAELERVTTYEGYTAESDSVKHFWSVVHAMSEEEKRQLLQFTTGSDRIPVGGMSKMSFKIVRQRPDRTRLPSAHTCFNILLLPDYSTRDQLERLLKIAISHYKGFVDTLTGKLMQEIQPLVLASEGRSHMTSANDDNNRQAMACFNVVELANARSAELVAFEREVGLLTARAITGLQRLPTRLRRRAASRRPNRIPLRLHRSSAVNATTSETGKGKRKCHKSRRFRRRHLRLLAWAARFTATTSSSSKPYWLPTHLWHAKRFHMRSQWGWRLPWAATDKRFKACQRAASRGCLLFDMSYLHCIELTSCNHQLLQQVVQLVFEPQSSPSSQQPLLDDSTDVPSVACEIVGLLFSDIQQRNQDSNHVAHNIGRRLIGPVRLLWSRPDEKPNSTRRLWVWLHPTIAESGKDVLKRAINSLSTPNHDLSLSDVSGRLCRLRLIGCQSHTMLFDTLTQQRDDVRPYDEVDWPVWNWLGQSYSQAGGLPCGAVLYLPHCAPFLANKPKLKLRDQDWIASLVDRNQTDITNARLTWKAFSNRLLNQQLPQPVATQQSSMSDPFLSSPPVLSDNNVDPSETNWSNICTNSDILLIQNATPSVACKHPLSIGWDIVLPRIQQQPTEKQSLLAGTLASRDLLISLVYRGAEVGGLRDLQQWATLGTCGMGLMDAFPSCWPDTPAGRLNDEEIGAEKKSNFTTFPRRDQPVSDCPSPPPPSWSRLTNQLTDSINEDDPTSLVVLRDRALLQLVAQRVLGGDSRARLSIDQLSRFHSLLPRSIFLVNISASLGGKPGPCAGIYAAAIRSTSRRSTTNRHIDDNSSPTLIGYVVSGGYGLSVGHGVGLGFVCLGLLCKTVTSAELSNQLHFSIRNPNSPNFFDVNLSTVV